MEERAFRSEKWGRNPSKFSSLSLSFAHAHGNGNIYIALHIEIMLSSTQLPRSVVPSLESPDILGLHLAEILASIASGEGLWEF